jgi:2-methylfumaryl-CoA isomerase
VEGIRKGLRVVEGSAFAAVQRHDLNMVSFVGRRDGGSEVDYTFNPLIGIPFKAGPMTSPEPVNPVFPVRDFVSGHMIALGLLAAERHRRLTGQGQLVKIALKDVALPMLGNFGMIAEVMINDADRTKARELFIWRLWPQFPDAGW